MTASNALITGTASIAFLNVTIESSSVIYSSGSNQFGDASNDTQTLYGKVDVKTGPLVITGSVNVTGSDVILAQGSNLVTHHVKASAVNGVEIQNNAGGVVGLFGAGGGLGTTFYGQINATAISASSFISSSQFVGNLQGTASFANNATSASFATNATSASFATTATSASFASTSTSASFATSASQAQNTVSASYAVFATGAGAANSATSASYAVSASFAENALSASYAPAGNPFPFTGSAIITGSLLVTGSVRGNISALTISSNTASLDCSKSNFFTLSLVSGSVTHINPTNINPGQTINLQLIQPAVGYGNITYPYTIRTQNGQQITPTLAANAIDVVSLVTFDTSFLYATTVKNLT